MTTVAEPVFLDTNVLIYTRLALSPFHSAAVLKVEALEAAGHELWISRQTLREYLSGMSRPSALTGQIAMSSLLLDVQGFVASYHIAEDGPAVTAELINLLTSVGVGGKQVHDANIVATMRTHGVARLLTNNVADFNRFASLITVEPLVP